MEEKDVFLFIFTQLDNQKTPEPKRHLALSDRQVSRLLREWFGVRLLRKEGKYDKLW